MLEQEIASLMRFIIEKAGNPAPYYDEVSEGFLLPAIYFPSPEIESDGDTLQTYVLTYTWFINIFHVDKPSAHGAALSVLNGIRKARNLIPLIDSAGNMTDDGFRIKDPSVKILDLSHAAAQLSITWNSIRPYADVDIEQPKTTGYSLNMITKKAFQTALTDRRIL